MSAASLLDALITSCVVVTTSDDGTPHGCLVASIMPVGYGTETVVFALTTGSRTQQAVLRSGIAAINLLHEADLATALVFSTNVDRFGAVPWSRGALGAPMLMGAVGVLELTTTTWVGEAGGCSVVCGEVGDAVLFGPPGPVMTIAGIRSAGVEVGRATQLEDGHGR